MKIDIKTGTTDMKDITEKDLTQNKHKKTELAPRQPTYSADIESRAPTTSTYYNICHLWTLATLCEG
jgi:hypothetical protein